MVTKFFDEQGSNDLKGKFIVQSPTKFAFDSFYRKRDKGTIKPGVTLLMARHEDTAREEPVAIFFNRSKFTEEEASQWWDQNNFGLRSLERNHRRLKKSKKKTRKRKR